MQPLATVVVYVSLQQEQSRAKDRKRWSRCFLLGRVTAWTSPEHFLITQSHPHSPSRFSRLSSQGLSDVSIATQHTPKAMRPSPPDGSCDASFYTNCLTTPRSAAVPRCAHTVRGQVLEGERKRPGAERTFARLDARPLFFLAPNSGTGRNSGSWRSAVSARTFVYWRSRCHPKSFRSRAVRMLVAHQLQLSPKLLLHR